MSCSLIRVIKIYHDYVLFSDSSVSEIQFKKENISNNWSSNFRDFTVHGT